MLYNSKEENAVDTKTSLMINEMAECERPREKLTLKGPESLTNAELIAILIRTGSKNVSALDLARRIVNMDKEGIRSLYNVSIEELSKVKGVGNAKACQIVAALELGKRLSRSSMGHRPRITHPEDISRIYMEEMRYLKKEIFKVVMLNTKNEVICDTDVSVGSLNSSIVHPREVFVEPIRRSANSIVLIHNHPSGNPDPSAEDKNITKRLLECSSLIGIKILDHIILGDGVYYSFKEHSLI